MCKKQTIIYSITDQTDNDVNKAFRKGLEDQRKEWIKESSLPRNSNKADDRILSLIFYTKKLMLPMNTIQLPIEYLWLTLDYNDRLYLGRPRRNRPTTGAGPAGQAKK